MIKGGSRTCFDHRGFLQINTPLVDRNRRYERADGSYMREAALSESAAAESWCLQNLLLLSGFEAFVFITECEQKLGTI